MICQTMDSRHAGFFEANRAAKSLGACHTAVRNGFWASRIISVVRTSITSQVGIDRRGIWAGERQDEMPLLDNRQQLTLWEEFWSRYSPPKSVADVSSFDQRLVALLVKMGKRLPHEAMILEIGCGGSVLLPLAVMRLGVKAGVGIDYSWRGCQLARECLRNFGVLNAYVICGDVLEANPIRENSCHLVYSFGLIEHFDDPIPILREHVRAASRRGGVLWWGLQILRALLAACRGGLIPQYSNGMWRSAEIGFSDAFATRVSTMCRWNRLGCSTLA